jgi:hypothetical protein
LHHRASDDTLMKPDGPPRRVDKRRRPAQAADDHGPVPVATPAPVPAPAPVPVRSAKRAKKR